MRSRRYPLSRRTFLRGAGGVCLGLPFLEEMARTAYARTLDDLPRYISVFLPLGIPYEVTEGGTAARLESRALTPLAPFRDRLSVFRGIRYTERGGHDLNQGHVFIGGNPLRDKRRYGNSLDQALLERFREAYPDQGFRDLHVGIMASQPEPNKGIYPLVQSWRGNGEEPIPPLRDQAAVFIRITGGGRAAADVARHPSVLDAVREATRSLLSPRTGLGASSKRKVEAYLEEVRELERRVLASADISCGGNNEPPALPDLDFFSFEEHAEAHMDLMLDLFALGMRCDPSLRFGTVALGRAADDFMVLDEAAGARLGIHHAHHRGRSPAWDNAARLQMRLFCLLLEKLAGTPDGAVESNMLANTMVLLGGELGEHSRGHSGTDVFHVAAGLDARFQHGAYSTAAHAHVDLYSTVMRAFGVDAVHGDPRFHTGLVSGLLNQIPDSVG
ncbi:MAG: DUF1552 domain-containing protein [Myxococcota bacterium]